MIECSYKISGYDITPDGNIKPSTCLKFMQDAANEDAKQLGADYNSMKDDNMIFVVSKMKVCLYDIPSFDSMVTVRTWNNNISGVTFQREYELSSNGRVIGKATSRWALINYKTRQLLRSDTLKNCVTTSSEEDNGILLQRRIKISDDVGCQVNHYVATLSDLDANGHVNNCRYGDFLIDYCGLPLADKKISEFEIHYMNEMLVGEKSTFRSYAESDIANIIATDDNGKQIFSATLLVK